MSRSDAERFLRAQAHFGLTPNERDNDPEGAVDWAWFEACCREIIKALVKQHPPSRKRTKADVEQDAWLALLRKLPNLKCRPDCEDIRPWLREIVESILISFTRRRTHKVEEPLPTALNVPARSGSAALAHAELRDELLAALELFEAKLGPKNRVLIELHYLEGLPMHEAAGRVGVTETKAWSRQRRTLRKLRKLLRGHPEWPHLAEWIERHEFLQKNGDSLQNLRQVSAPTGVS